jgi:hypothetical protein
VRQERAALKLVECVNKLGLVMSNRRRTERTAARDKDARAAPLGEIVLRDATERRPRAGAPNEASWPHHDVGPMPQLPFGFR